MLHSSWEIIYVVLTIKNRLRCYLLSYSFYTLPMSSFGEGNSNPLQYSCLENPMDRGAWQATVHGVARVGHNLVTKPPPPPQEKKKLSWVVTYICRFKFHCFLYGIHYRMFLHICFGSCCTNNLSKNIWN